MSNQHPRIVAAVVIRQDDRILVAECMDKNSDQLYYRPITDQVELGERAEQTAARMADNQLGLDIKEVRFLGAIENVENCEDQIVHDLLLVYEAAFVEEQYYNWMMLPVTSGNGSTHAVWHFLADFEDEHDYLYPPGLLDLLVSQNASLYNTPLFGGAPLFTQRRDEYVSGLV